MPEWKPSPSPIGSVWFLIIYPSRNVSAIFPSFVNMSPQSKQSIVLSGAGIETKGSEPYSQGKNQVNIPWVQQAAPSRAQSVLK